MREPPSFRTTSLPLAAALLSEVRAASIGGISNTPSIDGRKLISITYPPAQEQAVSQVAELFHQRRLTVGLYPFNRALNALRDRLHDGGPAPWHQHIPPQSQ